MSSSRVLTRLLPVLAVLALAGMTPSRSPSPVHAQDDLPGIAESHVLGGQISQMVIQGRHVYTVAADRLLVFDLEAPSGIEQVATIRPDGAFGSWLASAGLSSSQLLVSDVDRVWRFDLSDPSRPVEVDRFDAIGWIVGIEDDVAYLMTDGQLSIVDIDPGGPMRLLASEDLGDTRRIGGVSDGRFVVVEGLWRDAVLRVIDVRDPDQVTELGRLAVEGAGRPLVRGDHVFLESDDCSAQLCLSIVDIGDPSSPRLVATAASALTSGGYIVGALWDRGLVAFQHIGSSTVVEWFDISDITQPQSVGLLDLPGVFGLHAMVETPDGSLLGSDASLQAVALEDPSAAAVTSSIPLLGVASGACAFDDRWLVFGQEGGAWLLESAGSPPLAVRDWIGRDSRLVAWGSSSPVACGDGLAFATSRVDAGDTSSSLGSQIHMLDLRQPGSPTATTVPLPNSRSVSALTHASSGLVTIENFMHTDIPLLLRTWDSSQPASFAERGRLDLEAGEYPSFISAAADGATVVVAIDQHLHLVDVSDPDRPRLDASLTVDQALLGIDIHGGLAVAVDGAANLVVIDVDEARVLAVHAIEEAGDGFVNLRDVQLLEGRAFISGDHFDPILPDDRLFGTEGRLWSVDLRENERAVYRMSQAPSKGFLTRSADGQRLGVSGLAGFAELLLGEGAAPEPPRDPSPIWLPFLHR